MGLLDIISQYLDPNAAPPADVHQHFDEVARQAPTEDLGPAVAAALRSDATPPFGQAVGDLFGRSNPDQRAGLLNQLIQTFGPAALTSLAGGVLGRALGNAQSGPATMATPITPSQASQVSPSDVASAAEAAQQHRPSIVDEVSGFYAQHPALVKTLGAAALAVTIRNLHRT